MKISEITAQLRKASNKFTVFAKLERIIAVICFLIPAFLIYADGGPIRHSISNYVYMNNSHIFGLLLAIAAMMFIVNGAVYIKTPYLKEKKKSGKWYNIVLGISLMGVAILPHYEFPISHYIAAVIFFVGSAFVIAIFNDKEHRKISIFIAAASLLSLIVFLINEHWFKVPGFGWLSLFWAEWISLTVIAVHYILESLEELS